MSTTMTDIAVSLGISEGELFRQALVSFLKDKKRQTLQLKLDILARYGVNTVADLDARIAHGSVSEHPAWEDLIVAENLTARLKELDDYLEHLQVAGGNRDQ